MGNRPQQVRLEGPLTYLPTANLLIRRTIWQQLGGFAPLSQGEDVDFCRRMLLSGAHIRYVPQGTVYHDYRTTLKSFLKIRAAYATAEAALLQRHPTERRILILPPEQATFAGFVLGGLWCVLLSFLPNKRNIVRVRCITPLGVGVRCIAPKHERSNVRSPFIVTFIIGTFLSALSLTLFSTRNRHQKVQQQHIPIPFVTVFKATLRGNLAYTYHLCRHLTRYYTLPLLLLGLLFFPFAILIAIMLCIVVSVDYWRLKPSMNWFAYAVCAILNDCAYEVGVVQGCIKQKTWKPLMPIIRKRM
jgi:cellulose synthase/poly-beta-1,6-N-acetylglucosamine synthase-like glycosyltransferase